VRQDNPFAKRTIMSWQRSPGEFVQTKEDGTFEATVYAGPGTLLAKGPTRDYVLQRLDTKELTVGQKGGAPLYADGAAPLDLKADAEASALSIKLQRGVTIQGRVLDPDGKPVKSAVVYHALSLGDNGGALYPEGRLRDNRDLAYFHYYDLTPIAVKDGTFALTGLSPKAKLSIFVLDRTNARGAVAEVSGKDVTVKLQPCGQAKGRFVDAGDKPLKGRSVRLDFVLDADRQTWLSQADALGGWAALKPSDAEGRVIVPGLIPGAKYRYFDGKKVQEFTAEAGKTRDLGDLPPPRGGGGGAGAP